MSGELREEAHEFWEGIAQAWPYIGKIVNKKITDITERMAQRGQITTLEELAYQQGRIDAFKTILILPKEQLQKTKKGR